MESGLPSLTNQSYAKLVVIRDPYVGKHSHEPRAQLRSLPLLIEHGFDRVIHTDLWDNDFKPVAYDHLSPDEVDPTTIEFPLVHVVSQEQLIDEGQQHLVRSLLKNRRQDDVYIVVTDTNAPRTPAYTTERAFVDEFTPNKNVDFERRVTDYIQKNLDSALPVSNNRGSKNLYYHQISHCHKAVGAPASSLPDLFNYDKAPPDSPAWDPLYYFVEHDLDSILDEYTERIRAALRSWTERGDVQRIANNMDSMLTRCQFRPDRLDEQRQRNATLYNNA